MWGVVEEMDNAGRFRAYHIIPMVNVDGDLLVSGAHDISAKCHCGPLLERSHTDPTTKIYNHYDPDADGALTAEEWRQRYGLSEGRSVKQGRKTAHRRDAHSPN
jgi:hypothetical protein